MGKSLFFLPGPDEIIDHFFLRQFVKIHDSKKQNTDHRISEVSLISAQNNIERYSDISDSDFSALDD